MDFWCNDIIYRYLLQRWLVLTVIRTCNINIFPLFVEVESLTEISIPFADLPQATNFNLIPYLGSGHYVNIYIIIAYSFITLLADRIALLLMHVFNAINSDVAIIVSKRQTATRLVFAGQYVIRQINL